MIISQIIHKIIEPLEDTISANRFLYQSQEDAEQDQMPLL